MMGPTKLREVRDALATGVAVAPPAAPTADELEALARTLGGPATAAVVPAAIQPDGLRQLPPPPLAFPSPPRPLS